jgi:hypothetical protein
MSLVLQSSGGGQITIQEPATASNFTATLPASTGTILTTGSPQSGGVIQVVQGTFGTLVSSSSSTFVDTGLTATITPKFATSRILCVVSMNGCAKDTNNNGLALQLLRNATVISNFVNTGGFTNSTATNRFGSCSTNFLDSPATTSATTYKVQFSAPQNTGNVYICIDGASSTSTITLMEIAS